MPAPASELKRSSARNIYAFGITSFLNDTASEMAYWVLPAFLVSLGAGPAQLGLIEGLAESVASFAKLFSGYLTDRINRRKPLVVAGYFVANAVKPLLAVVTAWWHILLIRFSDRLAKGVAVESLLLDDGLHLSVAGHDLYLEFMRPTLHAAISEFANAGKPSL